MEVNIFNTYEAMCRKTADEIAADLKNNPAQMLCIAAGHTSLGVFKCLVEDYNKHLIDFSRAFFVAMDEWLNMSWETTESCGAFIMEHFIKYVNYPPENVRLWDGTKSNVQQECADVERFIKEKSSKGHLDFLVLGSGMNGHLALNEPGTSFSSTAHVTALAPMTQTVGQKYFTKGAALSDGITLGIENFRQSGRSVLLINGDKKADIADKILSAKVPDEQIPATALLTFTNTAIYCDAQAAQMWQKKQNK